MTPSHSHALILGAGPGLSASLARLFRTKGLRVTLAARNVDKLAPLCQATGARAVACDVSDRRDIARVFETLDEGGAPDVMVYNPSARVRGRITEIDPEGVARAFAVSALGACRAAREAAIRMESQGHGAMLFTGASASVKGYPGSSVFAMGKFALRGLCQSLARELHPKGVHVGHFVIDGAIRNPAREAERPEPGPDAHLDPDAIAAAYWSFLEQDRSAWAWEIELRPWVERF